VSPELAAKTPTAVLYFVVKDYWIGARDEMERRCPGVGPVDEDVGEHPFIAHGEVHAYEDEGAIRADDHGPSPRISLLVGPVDDAA